MGNDTGSYPDQSKHEITLTKFQIIFQSSSFGLWNNMWLTFTSKCQAGGR